MTSFKRNFDLFKWTYEPHSSSFPKQKMCSFLYFGLRVKCQCSIIKNAELSWDGSFWISKVHLTIFSFLLIACRRSAGSSFTSQFKLTDLKYFRCGCNSFSGSFSGFFEERLRVRGFFLCHYVKKTFWWSSSGKRHGSPDVYILRSFLRFLTEIFLFTKYFLFVFGAFMLTKHYAAVWTPVLKTMRV